LIVFDREMPGYYIPSTIMMYTNPKNIIRREYISYHT
jgi:hypothetical protein